MLLKWERRKNRRLGKPNLEHAPMILGYHMHKHFAEARYEKLKAKYDAVKYFEDSSDE